MSRLLALVPLLWLTGCLEAIWTITTIDLRRNEVTYVQRDLRGGAEELDAARTVFERGEPDPIEGLTLIGHRLEEHEGVLQGTLVYTFTDPAVLGLGPWDDRGALQLCDKESLSSSNADFRDTRGCVVWKRGRTTLRVEERKWPTWGSPSLLAEWEKVQAPG